MIWLASAGLALIIAAFLLRWWAQRTAAALELSGEVLYSDGDTPADVLVSEAHRLVGKPDYILERDGELVPVERKSRKLSTAGAYEGEILQLGKGKGRYLKLVHLYPEKSRIPWVIPVPGYRTIFTKESLGRSSSVPVRLSGKETLLQLYETLSTPQTHPMCFRQIC